MTKVEVYWYPSRMILVVLLCLACMTATSQYRLKIESLDHDSTALKPFSIQKLFPGKEACSVYVNKLPELFHNKGFTAASVDTAWYDSTTATAVVFLGQQYPVGTINTDSVDPGLLRAVRWDALRKNGLSMQQLESIRQQLLDELEKTGYPFGEVLLDSMRFENGGLHSKLLVNKGPRYKIDSVRNLGDAKISDAFLHFHLGITKGSYYNREKLEAITRKIAELPYLQQQQPFSLTMLGTGSVVNLYLQPKKSSQVNVLVGLLPSSEQLGTGKMQVTGEALVNLRNALGNGETMGLNWQQIQVKSPRLNILFQQPFLFNSPFGVNFNFDLFKKDSSFVNVSILLGMQYTLSSNKAGSIFFQSRRSNLLSVDTMMVKTARRLPAEADVSSMNVGINYEWFNTDYRLSPRKGSEFRITTSAGTKTIKKNNVIVRLQDQSDPSFDFNKLYDTLSLKSWQLRMQVSFAHFFSINRTSSLKTSVTGGWFESPDIFRNELFQIGGYRLLRGFDEESIFASGYAVAGIEYRYFMGANSYLFGFVDQGFATNTIQSVKPGNTFTGGGLGMAFETKAGIFNISYAAGKRGGEKLNLRQSKIHLGYVNYF